MSKAPYKAAPFKLEKNASVSELARRSLASASKQMRKNTKGACRDRDPDFTHQLRVGARRARVVVSMFKAPIGKACARSLSAELRWIFRLAGELRDLDVLLSDVIEPLASDDVNPPLELLAGELTRQRELAARHFKHALTSKPYRRLLRTLREVEEALQSASVHGDKPARKWARKRLDERLAGVLALRQAAQGVDEEARHELRKRLKKLRYAAELVRSLWPKKRVKAYLDAMEALQDTLGAINDAATGRHLLGKASAELSADVSAATQLCEQSLNAKVAEHAPSLEQSFFAFEQATPFWRRR